MQRERIETVDINNWQDIGPAYEANTEDGPATFLPDPAIVVTALTPQGNLYVYPQEFPTFALAHEFTLQIQGKGSINPERWDLLRAIYGSAAYFNEGWHDLDMRLN